MSHPAQAGQPRHDLPPPLGGTTGTNLQGLALAVAVQRVHCRTKGPLEVAVLGAGGACSRLDPS